MSVTGTGATIQGPQVLAAVGNVGGFVSPSSPNYTDFLNFLATSVQIPGTALPSTSPWPEYAFAQAMTIVQAAPVGVVYSLAVYNLATHLLMLITPDQPGSNYFANARQDMKLLQPSTGLIVSTSDNGTSATNIAPEWAKGLTVSQLGYYRTPWGRDYLGYAQSYGGTIVGLT